MKEGRVYPTRRTQNDVKTEVENLDLHKLKSVKVKPPNTERTSLVEAWNILHRQNNALSTWKHYVCTKRESRKSFKKMRSKKMFKIYENLKEPAAFLDSDIEENASSVCNDIPRGKNDTRLSPNSQSAQSASNRALLIYFAKLARADPESPTTVVDFDFVDSLLQGGADVNVCDRYGQTIFHEASRAWHCDVALFLLEKGADINKADRYGRTAMHVAAAVDYAEMIRFLFDHGGKWPGYYYFTS